MLSVCSLWIKTISNATPILLRRIFSNSVRAVTLPKYFILRLLISILLRMLKTKRTLICKRLIFLKPFLFIQIKSTLCIFYMLNMLIVGIIMDQISFYSRNQKKGRQILLSFLRVMTIVKLLLKFITLLIEFNFYAIYYSCMLLILFL